MARLKFDSVFNKHEDGSLEVRQTTRIAGIVLNSGLKLSKGVAVGGINFHDFLDRDLEVDTDGNTLVIKGIYADAEETDN